MAIVFKKDINKGRLLLGELIQNEEKGVAMLPVLDRDEFSRRDYKRAMHRVQFLTGRLLTKKLIEDLVQKEYQGIECDGKIPAVVCGVSHQVTISHSDQLVVSYVNEGKVGVDIQQIIPRISGIVPRIFSAHELGLAGDSLVLQALIWAVKEALFKWWRNTGMEFSTQLLVDEIIQKNDSYLIHARVCDGEERVVMLKGNRLHYNEKDYILVYTMG